MVHDGFDGGDPLDWLYPAAAGDWEEAAQRASQGGWPASPELLMARVLQLSRWLGGDHGQRDPAVAAAAVAASAGSLPSAMVELVMSGGRNLADSVHLLALDLADLASVLLAASGVTLTDNVLVQAALATLQEHGYPLSQAQTAQDVFGALAAVIDHAEYLQAWQQALTAAVTAAGPPSLTVTPFAGWNPADEADMFDVIAPDPWPDPAPALDGFGNYVHDAGAHTDAPQAVAALPAPAGDAGTAPAGPVRPAPAKGAARRRKGRLLSDVDKQLIGTLLTHPAMGLTDLARLYGRTRQNLIPLLEGLGLRLGRPVKASEVAEYVWSHQTTVRKQAGLRPGDPLPTLPVKAPEPLNQLDRQLIGTLLTHPKASLRDLSRLYGLRTHALDAGLVALGLKLGEPGTSTQVAQHVRSNRDVVVAQAGLRPGDPLPTLPPRAAKPLTELDRQLIGTLLTHPEMALSYLAALHGISKHRLQGWLEGLGLRLGKPGTGTEVAQYVWSHQTTVLAQAGLRPGDPLPTLPARADASL
ncbi:hypothetical protein [Streptomyces sp. NPDC051014]|uniref:hypothetical protein n=1 Tax=Streptomyces sp. NPDC051014 TaxID=3155751 RepID=UPI0033D76F44